MFCIYLSRFGFGRSGRFFYFWIFELLQIVNSESECMNNGFQSPVLRVFGLPGKDFVERSFGYSSLIANLLQCFTTFLLHYIQRVYQHFNSSFL